jgi:transposase
MLDLARLCNAMDLTCTPSSIAGDLHERALTTAERFALGEFYTPAPIAQHLLDLAGYTADTKFLHAPILDVAIGFGVFLSEAARLVIQAAQEHGRSELEVCATLGSLLWGYDLHPLAIIGAKAHLLLTFVEALRPSARQLAPLLEALHFPHIRCAEVDLPKATGRPRVDARRTLGAIIFRMRSGCQWNQLPERFPDDSSVHRTFQRWVRLGLFERIWGTLLTACQELGGVDWEWQAADGAMGKARLGGPHRPQSDRSRQTRREAQSAGRGGRWAAGRGDCRSQCA